jgi:magnesium chelatase family protein
LVATQGRVMSLASVQCRAQIGLDAPLVHVEVDLGDGLPGLVLVGLPATVVRESKERVRAAVLNSGFAFPAGRIVVNLAPADLPKEGGWFDLPIALGILLASNQIKAPPTGRLARSEFYGELALGGDLKPVRGLLLAAVQAGRAGHEVIVPDGSSAEASRAPGVTVRAARRLLDVCAHLEDRCVLGPALCVDPSTGAPSDCATDVLDLRDIRGQSQAKRALMIAATGGHSLLFVGVPGSGKSTLARSLPGLLPPLSEAEALQVASIASASPAGFDARNFGVRPFRAPHHTASATSIVGGGPYARPGEISLAHHGVLFLDELPEFERRVLEALREPLETGEISISRAARCAQYPAAFQLIAAMNPCPCGYQGDPRGTCHCTPEVIERYRRRISGPLLDRLDLHIEVPRVTTRDMVELKAVGADSGQTAALVRQARELQSGRQGVCNARLAVCDIARYCTPDEQGRALLERAAEKFHLSARGYHRVLRIARTIADLAGEEQALERHVAEAIGLRKLANGAPRDIEAPGAQAEPVT